MPALKPYRGKPAVRNFREGGGNVGIIRSPVRATTLPDFFRMKCKNEKTKQEEKSKTVSGGVFAHFGVLQKKWSLVVRNAL